MIRADAPFVLLDDMRAGGGGAHLFRDPVDVVVATEIGEVRPALERIRRETRAGLHASGYLAYEAGAALEPRLPLPPAGAPLLWFGLFDRVEAIASGDIPARLPDPAASWAAPPRPAIAEDQHAGALAAVQAAIAAGDIYQANLTFPAEVRIAGDPLALYARLRAQAAAPWGGIVFTGARWLLSFSPELFFTLEDGRITSRPMKGTARRGRDDAATARALAADPKQRAENLMIVDLIRNDLARVSTPGSVAVPALFTVETYPTIHQMTSTVTAMLEPGLDAIDVLAAAFPCGSVTGAPKIRAMEIIGTVERAPRSAYTGSIGRIGPGGEAAFNVAIRTLELGRGADCANLGLGSGIVADSRARDEWRECLAKGAFVTAGQTPFDLIETMCFEPEGGIADLERHLTRMKQSAAALGFAFNRHALRNELQAATFWLGEPKMIRVLLSPTGRAAVEVRPKPAPPDEPVAVSVRPLPLSPADFRLRHKTSDRGFYTRARAEAGTFEVVFSDPEGFLTEGSYTNIFLERDGALLTPPLTRGVLPGVLRGRLIDEGRAREADLRAQDLQAGFFIGNAVRGLLAARLVAAGGSAGL